MALAHSQHNPEVNKVTGQGDYVSDLVLPGMAHAKLLRSPLAHARVMEIRTQAAEAQPGVIAVVTARDLEGLDPFYGMLIRDQPLLAIDKVRHVGDVIAAVVAEDEQTAYAALAKIEVDYEKLPAVPTIPAALAENAPIIFPDRVRTKSGTFDPSTGGIIEPEGNVLYRFDHEFGNLEAAFAKADRVFEDQFEFSRMSHYHLEPLVAVARAQGDSIELWSNTQDPFEIRRDLARVFRVSEESIRIHGGLIGGGFGAKSHCKIEPLTVLLSRKAKRPVRLAPGMDEAMLSLSQHAAILRLRTGVSFSGELIARECRAWIDAGAYADASVIVASQLGYCLPGPYRWTATRVQVQAVRTTTVPAGSFRGYGRPQATWASESQIDMIARRLALSPLIVRQLNLLEHGADFLPDDTPVDCHLSAGLERVAEAIDFGGRRPSGRGVGLAIGFKGAGGHWRRSEARILHDPEGETLVELGSADMGQGTRVVVTRVVSEMLGIQPQRVRILPIDTQTTPYDDGTHACTGVVLAAAAVQLAAQDVLAQMNAGTNHGLVIGYGRKVDARRTGIKFGSNPLYWQPAWAAAEVDVDETTAVIRVRKLVVAADAGRAIDMAKCDGQVLGGAIQGLGQALFECLRFENAEPLNASPRRYRLPLASDLPDQLFSIVLETGGGPGPFGAKGIGEAGIMPVAAAIANAVDDAVGVRLTSLPMTATALNQARRSEPKPHIGRFGGARQMMSGELVGCHSTARIAPFELARPTTPEGVLALMRQGAVVMCGGIDLIDRMKSGYRVNTIAHLGGVDAMKQVTFDGSTLRVGAALTHRAIAADPTIRAVLPDLARAWKGLGNARIQARGSLGGNLMADVAAYEAATILAACEARATMINLDGERHDLPMSGVVDSRSLLLHVSIADPLTIRLAVDRSIRGYAVIARADYPTGKVVVAVGGDARVPSLATGGDAPFVSGPHADYLRDVLPGLIAKMPHA